MRLFLASQASKTLDKIVPLLQSSPKTLTVAFIPTAGDPYPEKPWMVEDRKKLLDLGFRVRDVDLKEKNEQVLEKELKDINIVFIAGGNTFYLLEKAEKSGFDRVIRKLLNNGVLYIGSSAGSVIAGPDIEPVAIFDNPKEGSLLSTTGFQLVDFVVLPHYKKEKYGAYHEKVLKDFGDKYKFVLLADNQAIYIEDDQQKILES